jgi:hypothetical protein
VKVRGADTQSKKNQKKLLIRVLVLAAWPIFIFNQRASIIVHAGNRKLSCWNIYENYLLFQVRKSFIS